VGRLSNGTGDVTVTSLAGEPAQRGTLRPDIPAIGRRPRPKLH